MMTVTHMCTRRKDLERIQGPQFTLTRHFVENWIRRVGNEAHINAVKAIVEGSVLVQRGQKFLNGQGITVNTLSIYWHPELQIVIFIDRYENTAVSVLTGDNAPWPRGDFKRLVQPGKERHMEKENPI